MYAEDEARLLAEAAPDPSELDRLTERRIAGEPLEHLLGWVEFAGLRLAVGPGTFVPRRRTELLVVEGWAALTSLPRMSPPADPPVLVELCCGVAPVATAIARRAQLTGAGVEVHVADLDPTALRWARANLSADAGVHRGDLYTALPTALRGRVDVLIANAPYVPTEALATMPPEARLHEPRLALDGGRDGLDVQRRIVAETTAWLAPGGRLLIETGLRQAPTTAAAMAAHGLSTRVAHDEDLDATTVIGTWE